MNAVTTHPAAPFAAESVFSRVLAGVDGSDAGFEAARQAARLVGPNGSLELLTAVYLAGASLAGWSAPKIRAELEVDAGEAVRRAAAIAGPRATSRLVNGPAFASLMRELKRTEATLAVVGTHGHSRWSEMVIGGVAGELLHKAPCSVCIAREPAFEALFPRSVVAGYDGSPGAEDAVAVARHLAERFDVPLTVLTALGGKNVDSQRAEAIGAETVEGHPVQVLVQGGKNADLLVLGSRGLHGLRSLGSVSERVAHRANCSVLVVREQ
jgi:nucleotide-binding universal stress UspA family protein